MNTCAHTRILTLQSELIHTNYTKSYTMDDYIYKYEWAYMDYHSMELSSANYYVNTWNPMTKMKLCTSQDYEITPFK